MKTDFDTIMKKYQQALVLAKKTGDFKIECTVLNSMISTQREHKRNDLAGNYFKFN